MAMEIEATALFAALAHDTRLRCVTLLMHHDELCVCELTHALGASQPHISRSLGQLREIGLVADRREGIWVYYRINPAIPTWVRGVLGEAAKGLCGQGPFAEDEQALRAAPSRPAAARCA
jgi:ArsR family transcriptional regulator